MNFHHWGRLGVGPSWYGDNLAWGRLGMGMTGIPPETQKGGGGFITAKPQVQIDDVPGQSYKWVQGNKPLLQGPYKVQFKGF